MTSTIVNGIVGTAESAIEGEVKTVLAEVPEFFEDLAIRALSRRILAGVAAGYDEMHLWGMFMMDAVQKVIAALETTKIEDLPPAFAPAITQLADGYDVAKLYFKDADALVAEGAGSAILHAAVRSSTIFQDARQALRTYIAQTGYEASTPAAKAVLAHVMSLQPAAPPAAPQTPQQALADAAAKVGLPGPIADPSRDVAAPPPDPNGVSAS